LSRLFKLLLVSFVAFQVAGCSKNLTPKLAGKILIQQCRFPREFWEPVEVISVGMETQNGKILRDLGWLHYENLKGMPYPVIDLGTMSLTDEGKKYILSFIQPQAQLNVKIGKEIFQKVTGVKTDGKSALVEYDILLTDLTPYAKRMGTGNGSEGVMSSGSAEFSLYDDGWRLKKLTDPFRPNPQEF
jgi:hypothetical protein